ncbi:hypothetical protein HYH03_009843 [Edaphochlamys debaryana]|uniref:Tetrapyrrole biosynthesis uroporphyrinogen III synthase domain-containing protein n=1 Tax=Edaphochlamys debaryana TaxID=47281 RepID=A0A836BWN6_9CHLO|nr:hypothetical protein HYH03_009843 [Edaphochlamys debaryana]|eukprot:KAG2491891.1 hypothetical protein HYH03_009843 [Edaphochlamys debaryana]
MRDVQRYTVGSRCQRVIVTAPRLYSQKLCAKLINAGARPLVVPAVQIGELEEPEMGQLRARLQALLAAPPDRRPTHIAFTSRNGIFATLDQLAAVAGGVEAAVGWLRGSSIRLCALGADGEVLGGLGLNVHVSPKEASTLGLVKELVARGEAVGSRVLCPVPHVTGGLVEPPVVPRFLKALTDAGAFPERLPAYLTTLGCGPGACGAEREALQRGQVAAIAFSSTAEAQGLIQLMGGAEAFSEAVRAYRVVLAAHGPYTADGAGAVTGLPVTVVSKNFATFDGLIAALEEHFAAGTGAGAGAGAVPGAAAGVAAGAGTGARAGTAA